MMTFQHVFKVRVVFDCYLYIYIGNPPPRFASCSSECWCFESERFGGNLRSRYATQGQWIVLDLWSEAMYDDDPGDGW